MSAYDPHENAIEQRLRARGVRPTEARRRILSVLGRLTSHPTVEELHVELRDAGMPVQLPTLYQNLTVLAEAGLVHRIVDDRGLMRFDGDVVPHNHLLCSACGRIADLHMAEGGVVRLDELTSDVADAHADWRVEGVQLGVRGVCPACRAGS